MTYSDPAIVFAGVKIDVMKLRAVMPDGRRLDEKRFNVEFGGHSFKDFPRRKAWYVFYHSQPERI